MEGGYSFGRIYDTINILLGINELRSTYSSRFNPTSDQTLPVTGPCPRALSLMMPQPERWIYNGGFPGLLAELFSNPSKVAMYNKLSFLHHETEDIISQTFDTWPVIRTRGIDDDVSLLYLFNDDSRIIQGPFDDVQLRMDLL